MIYINKNKLKKKTYKIIILGSGPSGYTAAIYSARANLKPILITGNEKGGQLMNTLNIENWPGDYKKITGPELMDRMNKHAKKLKVKIIEDNIKKVNFTKKPFYLIGEKKKYYFYSLIIATGAKHRYLGLSSEKKYLGKGVSSCATCDGFLYKNKKVAVIGGGNTAIEEALFLSNISSKVYLIHRNEKFKAEKIILKKLFKKIKLGIIILYKNYVVKKILGNEINVTNIKIKNIINNKCKKIKINGIFIAIGYKPNTKIFKKQLKLKNNYIYINKNNINGNLTSTSVPGIFAAGDVSDSFYRQAITSSGTGCMAALDAEKYLDNLKK